MANNDDHRRRALLAPFFTALRRLPSPQIAVADNETGLRRRQRHSLALLIVAARLARYCFCSAGGGTSAAAAARRSSAVRLPVRRARRRAFSICAKRSA